MAGGLLVPRLRDVADRGVEREEDERDVDQERRAPGNGFHQEAPDERTQDRRAGRRSGPQSEGTALLLPLEGGRDDGEGTRDQQRPGSALEDAEGDQELDARSQAAQQRGDTEPHQAEREHPSPAVVVVQGSGQDEQ